MSKLEDMMKADGWRLGYYTNWGIKYWSFEKDGFEIPLRSISEFEEEETGRHFEPWREHDEKGL